MTDISELVIAQARVQELERELAEVRAVLRAAQWAAGLSWGPSPDDCAHRDASCYFCEREPHQGHAPDCRLRWALG